jgi:Thrombospondin type 3 repeat
MLRSIVGKSLGGVVAAGVLGLCAVSAQAITPFEQDVNDAIDAGLQYARTQGWFTGLAAGSYGPGNGLLLLALLEKTGGAGYAGLPPDDKTLARKAACLLIDDANFGDRGGFYSYYDGQVMMALSVYAQTGGPDIPGEVFGSYNCSARSVRATIDKVVDRTIAAQTPGVPAMSTAPGYWGYSGNGMDSSTTQLTAAGLGAAKSFYKNLGESADKNREPLITTALDKTSLAYSVNGKNTNVPSQCWDTCGDASKGQACWGHGYQANYGAPGSNQQTASGTWLQLLGTGKNVNNPAIQNYLRWLQNAYSSDTNVAPESWGESYFYYLWSSSKAYGFIEASGIAPAAGNISPASMGTLPAKAACYAGRSRMVNRDPETVVRPAPRNGGVAGPAGFYSGTPKGWYFDYAYRLMSLQSTTTGQFPNPNGSFSISADHGYALLVLLRSLGGACVDSDEDGICDKDDNCPAKPNPGQEDGDKDGVGDVCDNCPKAFNPGQEDSNKNGIGDACEVAKCDLDDDGDIDSNDIRAITRLRGKKVPPADPRADYDNNKYINVNDARGCTLICTRPKCATS